MYPWLFNFIMFAVAVLLLITVHELGHYWVARLSKVKVYAFSIGFGPALIKWTNKRGEEWKLSLIPLGGYVKIKGPHPDAKDGGDPDALCNAALWKQVLIFLAGPGMNFVLAAVLTGAAIWCIPGAEGGHNIGTAITHGVTQTIHETQLVGGAVHHMVKAHDASGLSSPVGIAKLVGDSAHVSIGALLWVLGAISLQLGLLNLIPIPPLDGGHLVRCALEICGVPRKWAYRIFGWLSIVGLLLIVALMATGFCNDLGRLFH
jgi:membrane-associated protease RseP (regulator of RpoE activity)